MSSMMAHSPDRSLATRESLLRRLMDCGDQASWQEFYATYRDLLWRFALKAGCTETEAEEVVQETVIAVARKLPEFKYDPAVCAFKTWLLNQAAWRVKDQVRKRGNIGQASRLSGAGEISPVAGQASALLSDDRRTATVERIADPAGNELEAAWETEWRQTVLEMAMRRVKEQANLKECQMFDLYVLRGWPAREVARALGVSVARVYLAKHRIAPLLKREVKAIEAGLL
jgi:RNA polymerase sigma-70 factor (ECF subfamily)